MAKTREQPASELARDVAERARAGDQNAMALIAETRKAAQKGSPRAREVLRAIFRYCEQYPVSAQEPAFISGDEPFSDDTKLALGTLKSVSKSAMFPPDIVTDALLTVSDAPGAMPKECALLFLANGPRLSIFTLEALADELTPQAGEIFFQSARGALQTKHAPEQLRVASICGCIVRGGRALQLARGGRADLLGKRLIVELYPTRPAQKAKP